MSSKTTMDIGQRGRQIPDARVCVQLQGKLCRMQIMLLFSSMVALKTYIPTPHMGDIGLEIFHRCLPKKKHPTQRPRSLHRHLSWNNIGCSISL